MTPIIAIIITLCCFIALSVWYSLRKSDYINHYHLRLCQGRNWKKEFPTAKNKDIREFLRCLVDSMDFHEKAKLKFSPNDKPIEIYRSIYGGKTPLSDEMECEMFILLLSNTFKIEPEKLIEPWKDEHVTLGDIFRTTQTVRSNN